MTGCSRPLAVTGGWASAWGSIQAVVRVSKGLSLHLTPC